MFLRIWVKADNYTDNFFKVNLSGTCVLLTDELNRNSFSHEVTATLKDITGRSSTDSRIMYSQETVRVKDYGIPFMATNVVPYVPFSDLAFWKRLHLVRLPNKFVNKKEDELDVNEYVLDENLEEKLANDKDGIEWLISASIEAYKKCGGKFTVTQSATDTQFIYDGKNPIKLFIDRFIVETNDNSNILSNLEIKYFLLKFCVRNNITQDDLGVDSSISLSREIAYKLKNKFRNLESVHKSFGVAYIGLILNKDDDSSINEISEDIKIFEEYIFY